MSQSNDDQLKRVCALLIQANKTIQDLSRLTVVLNVEGVLAPIGPFASEEQAREYAASALPNTKCSAVQCIPPC